MAAPSYPLVLPTALTDRTRAIWDSASFDLVRPNLATPFRDGGSQVSEVADPWWKISYKSVPLSATDVLHLKALFDSLQGGLQYLYATDPTRPYPINYPDGFSGLELQDGMSTAFDGTNIPITSLSTTNQIACQYAPSGFSIAIGDYCGLIESGNYGLFRCVGTSAEHSSGVINLHVEPAVDTDIFSTSATLNFVSPTCLAMVDRDSWRGTPVAEYAACAFTARQKVYVG